MSKAVKLPKWLIEFAPPDNWDELEAEYFDPPCQPKRPIWVCRTRNPFCIARVTIAGGDLLADETCHFRVEWWPPLLETPTNKFEKMTDEVGHTVCEFYDISPSQITQPEHRGLAPEPPPILHLWSHRDHEFILQPHEEHLWRLRENDDGNEETNLVIGWGNLIEGNPFDQTRKIQHWLRHGDS
jgi:hypothetical protein